MRTIYRYEIPEPGAPFAMDLPTEAELVRFDIQTDPGSLWFVGDTDAPRERRTFLRTATGAPLPAGELRLVGTAVWWAGGQAIAHLVELPSPPDPEVPEVTTADSKPWPWYAVELEARAAFAHDAGHLIGAMAGYRQLIAEPSPEEDTTEDLREIARAHGRLEKLVETAQRSGTITATEASVLLGDDLDAAIRLLSDITRDARLDSRSTGGGPRRIRPRRDGSEQALVCDQARGPASSSLMT
jgi:hypothetical protein